MSMFQVILLAVFGACAIAGVLIFALAVGRGNSNTIGNVVIWGTFDGNQFTDMLRTAADLDSSMLGVSYVQKDADSYLTSITDALASGQGPDLFILRQDYALSQEQRVIPIAFTELPRTDFETRFSDATAPFITPDNILAIPILIDPLVLYWNKDMLNTAGYARAPLYWDEVQDMAQKITKRTETGTIIKATIPFGLYRNVNNAKEILSMLVMQAGGQITARDNDGVLQSELAPSQREVAQSSLAALRFYTEFADPSKPGYSWNASLPEARKAFIAGDLALYVGLSSEKNLIKAANPNLNFAVSGVPQRRSAPTAINAGHTYAFAIPRTSKNALGARQVAYKLAAPETALAISTMLNLPSARRDVLSRPFTSDLNDFNKQAILVRSWSDPNPVRTSEIFRAMIEDTVSGSLLLGEAVQRADQEISAMLDGYNQMKNAQQIQ
ncbi:MAG: extracellular solute-binding protein [Candidatus Pacebacteria bacterium]|nr:extracellular solute-binding protein [Candidatus Paceibacterota bacterium]